MFRALQTERFNLERRSQPINIPFQQPDTFYISIADMKDKLRGDIDDNR